LFRSAKIEKLLELQKKSNKNKTNSLPCFPPLHILPKHIHLLTIIDLEVPHEGAFGFVAGDGHDEGDGYAV